MTEIVKIPLYQAIKIFLEEIGNPLRKYEVLLPEKFLQNKTFIKDSEDINEIEVLYVWNIFLHLSKAPAENVEPTISFYAFDTFLGEEVCSSEDIFNPIGLKLKREGDNRYNLWYFGRTKSMDNYISDNEIHGNQWLRRYTNISILPKDLEKVISKYKEVYNFIPELDKYVKTAEYKEALEKYKMNDYNTLLSFSPDDINEILKNIYEKNNIDTSEK